MDVHMLLNQVAEGKLSVEEAALALKKAPFEDLGYAKVDMHRKVRQGAGEVIYGAGKTPEQMIGILQAMREGGQERTLITRLSKESAEIISKKFNLKWMNAGTISIEIHPKQKNAETKKIYSDKENAAAKAQAFQYYEEARIGIFGGFPKANGIGKIVIATGGTSDIPVAEEAALTAEFLGNEVIRLYDVGVAGIHRLMARIDDIMSANVIIAVAGMEGALASVIGGLADCPVIAVPTSVGYGANFGGLSALLSMLNSCASGVSVVNIDNGFGAAYQASMINHISIGR
ncbi:MAG: nickel pincer cofactor biosynthesis protein LarB [Lachnospiraceae bacterium]|nr:nickel pincer cofactor biosynthesis protein LarB [Lachnospiraceae bacterium]